MRERGHQTPILGGAFAECRGRLDMTLLLLLVANATFLRYPRTAYPQLEFFSLVIFDIGLGVYASIRLISLDAKRLPPLILAISIIALGCITNFLVHGFNNQALRSAFEIVSPISVTIFLVYIVARYEDFLRSHMAAITRGLLGFFAVNSVIIYVQIATGTFLMGPFIGRNPNVVDHTDGVLGFNGVTILNYTQILTVLCCCWMLVKTGRHRYFWLAAAVFLASWHQSTLNDNKVFLLTITSFLVFAILMWSSARVGTGYTVAALLIVAGFLYAVAGQAYKFDLANTYLGELFIYDASVWPSPDNERGWLNHLAYERYNAGGLGIGLNQVVVDGRHIHIHLGINSATLLLISGGWPLLLLATLGFSLAASVLFRGGLHRPLYAFLGLFALYALTAYASQPFRDHYLVIVFMLCVSLVSLSPRRTSRGTEASMRKVWPQGSGRTVFRQPELKP